MTAPDTDLACSVYIDGNRLADTGAEYLDSVPTVLTGLSTSWGRATVIDQPDTSTCNFEVRDIDGDADFLGLLHVGRVVDVYTSAPSGNTQPTDVAEDGAFEITAPAQRVTVSNAVATAVFDSAAANTYYAIQTQSVSDGTVHLPPAPWGTSINGWDSIPEATVGETWTVSLDSGPGALPTTGTLALALFASPLRGAPVLTLPSVPLVAGTTTVSAVIPDGYPIVWVGAVMTITGGTAPWSSGVGSWQSQTLTWQQYVQSRNIDNLKVIAPAQARQRVSVFNGRITDLVAESAAASGVTVKVTAADQTADLANDAIGDTPWPVQGISTRVNRIRTLATSKFTADIASAISPVQMSYRDVDAQPVMGLLQEMAISADAVLWSAFEKTRGFYLWFEDPDLRVSMAVLGWNTDHTLVIITGNVHPEHGLYVSACEIYNDVTFKSDVSDVITRVDLTWQEQTIGDDSIPAPTERTVSVRDAPSELEFGVRRVAYSTQLISASEGSRVANRVLVRSRNIGWHTDGGTWDLSLSNRSPDALNAALAALDGTRRIGLPLVITELPPWAPSGDTVSMYLEGGTYTYENNTWKLGMNLSPAGYSGSSAKWNQLDPSYRWIDFDPTISWLDLWSVGA